jgi:hypothetical protein
MGAMMSTGDGKSSRCGRKSAVQLAMADEVC